MVGWEMGTLYVLKPIINNYVNQGCSKKCNDLEYLWIDIERRYNLPVQVINATPSPRQGRDIYVCVYISGIPEGHSCSH